VEQVPLERVVPLVAMLVPLVVMLVPLVAMLGPELRMSVLLLVTKSQPKLKVSIHSLMDPLFCFYSLVFVFFSLSTSFEATLFV
jgi:hypothetical protein